MLLDELVIRRLSMVAKATPVEYSPEPRRKGNPPESSVDTPPTRDQILEDIRVGLRQAVADEGRPAREAFRELRQKIAGNANSR